MLSSRSISPELITFQLFHVASSESRLLVSSFKDKPFALPLQSLAPITLPPQSLASFVLPIRSLASFALPLWSLAPCALPLWSLAPFTLPLQSLVLLHCLFEVSLLLRCLFGVSPPCFHRLGLVFHVASMESRPLASSGEDKPFPLHLRSLARLLPQVRTCLSRCLCGVSPSCFLC